MGIFGPRLDWLRCTFRGFGLHPFKETLSFCLRLFLLLKLRMFISDLSFAGERRALCAGESVRFSIFRDICSMVLRSEYSSPVSPDIVELQLSFREVWSFWVLPGVRFGRNKCHYICEYISIYRNRCI